MVPWETLARIRAPDGEELVLARRGEEHSIRTGNIELMSSRAHGSEEELARIACERIAASGAAPHVLVGGLGMGFTLRAALDALPAGARVTVAEVLPAVVDWNRGPLAHLAGRPLDDGRVQVEVRDVALVIASAPARFDAILLDVDNGPSALVRPANQALYGAAGLASARRALRPGGVLAVWSAGPHEGFVERLRHAGFDAEERRVPARAKGRGKGRGGLHVVFLGRR